METERILVYADWSGSVPEQIGILYCDRSKVREQFSFEYREDWLKTSAMQIDPELFLYRGRQYVPVEHSQFGVFLDSSPDRWGRLLMKRREAIRAKKAGEKPRNLTETDYLLGVYDEARMGALRFKTEENGRFLSDDRQLAAPPWAHLRSLENASRNFEQENGEEEKWLEQLFAPGSSLGGARPKANVLGPDGSLWIAKFPSKHDEWNTGAWEMTVHELAVRCGLHVPEAKLETFSSLGSTFLVKRFDRNGNKRIHFSSALTLLGKTDGASCADGSSYLDIVSFIRSHGAAPAKDLEELWKRIVFSIAVSNTDDHLRNHGFLLTKEGWRLSPMYDVNPGIYGNSLSLNINENDAAMSYNTAIETAPQFGLTKDRAKEISQLISDTVTKYWKYEAKKNGIAPGSIQQMESAFDSTYKW